MARPTHYSWPFQILQWMFPLPQDYEQVGPTYEELEERFPYAIIFQAISSLSLWLISSIGINYLLAYLVTLRASRFEPALYLFFASGKPTLPGAVFLGLFIASVFQITIERFIYKSRYDLYIRFLNLWGRYNFLKAMLPLLLPILLLSVAYTFVILNSQVAFRENEILFPVGLSFTHDSKSYSSITDIYTAPRSRAPIGTIVERRGYVIKFNDGSTLSSKSFPKNKKDPRVAEAIEYASKQSGKPIRELPILE